MANLRETSVWETGIYQWETSDPVMGGENGIDNKPTLQLANRTLWLKNEIAKAVESIGSNKTAADRALATKAAATTQMIAGNGLTGGGTLAANRTLTLGTPSSITASSTNSVTTTSHTHAIDKASTSTAGIVQLSTATNSTATNMAATPSAVKAAYDLAASKASPATTLAGYGITDWVVGAQSIDSNADLNTITATGIYYQASSANASVTLNYPEARAGTLEVMYAYGYMQRYTTTTGRIYLRVYNSGWGAWIRMDGLDAASAATTITAGNGLTGGGTLAANCTLTLGTPSSITASSTNSVTTTSHTHAIDQASTSTAGIVQLSTATNSTATNMAATPSAVKAAYDLATTITRKTYSRSYTPVNTTTAVTISGDTAVHPDGQVVQRFVLSDIRLMDLASESSPVGYGSGSQSRLLPLNLWTAMPNAVTDVRIQIQRAANNSRSQTYGAEACEWVAAWGQYLQATDKSKVSINLMRISGNMDEYVDVFVIVEGY